MTEHLFPQVPDDWITFQELRGNILKDTISWPNFETQAPFTLDAQRLDYKECHLELTSWLRLPTIITIRPEKLVIVDCQRKLYLKVGEAWHWVFIKRSADFGWMRDHGFFKSHQTLQGR